MLERGREAARDRLVGGVEVPVGIVSGEDEHAICPLYCLALA
jgi:hypothetical protein